MEDPYIFSVSLGEDCKLFSVMGDSSYGEFVTQITSKFFDLLVNDFSIRCSAGGVLNFRLECEDDFKNMITICRYSGSRIVKVELFISQAQNSVSGDSNRNGSSGGMVCRSQPRSVSRELNDSISVSSLGDSVESSLGFRVHHNVHGMEYVNQSHGDCYNDSDSVSNSKSDGCNDVGFCGAKVVRGDELCGQEVEFCGPISVPSYDICPVQKNKPLLSDSWVDIMKDKVGAIFHGGANEFRKELTKYCTQIGFKFKFIRNGKKYIYVVCENKVESGCQWFIKAKKQQSSISFEIYKGNFVHECVGKLIHPSKRRLGSAILSDLVLPNVKSNPSISGTDIIDYMRSNYGLDITYSQAWRSIENARDQIFGSYYESYDQLQWYCRAIYRTNPGSIVALEANKDTHHFERLFVAYKACIDGFYKCRPMLFVDGTFMKGRAKGILLSATAKDGDNGLFPVAFAIVSAENTDNWIWFLQMLKNNIKHEKQVFYISDRNAGLMSAFPKVFNEPIHFFCLFHLLNNLRGKFSGKLSAHDRAKMPKLFTDCAYAPNERLFKDKLEIFRQTGGHLSDEWLEGLDFEKWAVAYSPHIIRYGEMTSNAAESFNSWIRESRCLPITYMIDDIQTKLRRWYVERRKLSKEWTGALCPSKEKLWNHLSDVGRSWMVSECPHGDYQVLSTPSVVVDTRIKKCSCCQWQIKGFPCAHAVAVLRKVSDTVYSHVEECFFAEVYRQCYSSDIHSIPGTERYECQNDVNVDYKILPPILNRPLGRPKKKRDTSYGEFPKNKSKKQLFCDRCGKTGSHDSFTCYLPPVDKEINYYGSYCIED